MKFIDLKDFLKLKKKILPLKLKDKIDQDEYYFIKPFVQEKIPEKSKIHLKSHMDISRVLNYFLNIGFEFNLEDQ